MYREKLCTGIVISVLLSLMFVPIVPTHAWVYPDCTEDESFELFGPRLDRLLIKLYPNCFEAAGALELCEIDIMDCKVYDPSWIDWWIEPPFSETIKLVWQDCNLDEVALEINNNGTLPNGSPNPCSVSSFRQALAHLVDRDLIIEECFGGWAIPMYTEVPCACCLEKYCHPEIIPGGVLENLTHLYDPNEAARLLDENGFPIGPDGYRYWDRNGNGVPDLPEEELTLRFVIPDYYKPKACIGTLLHLELEAEPILIRNDPEILDNVGCYSQVMVNKDFHLYIGDRNLRKDPDYLYDMKHSQMYWHPGVCPNYINFSDPEYDYWAEILKCASTQSEAVEAAWMCQEIYASPCRIGSVPICMPIGYQAMKRCYSGGTGGVPVTPDDGENQYRCQPWKGIVNGYWDKCSCGGDYGINNWWTFLNAHPECHPMGDCEHMTMRYGLMTPELKSLNPIYASEFWDWEVMNKVYDTLIKNDPYHKWHPDLPQEIPWIAKDWEIGTWICPETEQNNTKLTFHLPTCVKWQDGIPFTAADVKFTIFDLPNKLAALGLPPPWWHMKVKQIHFVHMPDPCTVEVYFDCQSMWALQWIGTLKILPKHIWEPIIDAYPDTPPGYDPVDSFQPDPNLIGCGPWRFVEYVPNSHVLLVANKPCSVVDDIHSPGFFQWCPVYVNVHTNTPEEYEYRQRFPPCTEVTFKLTQHCLWKNKIPNTAEGENLGELIVNKYVWIEYPDGTQELVKEEHERQLDYCEPNIEVLGPYHFEKCHHKIKVAVHIKGPDTIPCTKKGEAIDMPNPWICQWINCTYDFWVTIQEDITGGSFDTWHDPPQLQIPDCKVNILDIGKTAMAFGSFPCHPKWEPHADIDGNMQINIVDIAMIATKFGWNPQAP